MSLNVLIATSKLKEYPQVVSINTLCKNILNVKNSVIENCYIYSDKDNVKHLRIKARPNKWHQNDCPFCHKTCSSYDKHSASPTVWRGLDCGDYWLKSNTRRTIRIYQSGYRWWCQMDYWMCKSIHSWICPLCGSIPCSWMGYGGTWWGQTRCLAWCLWWIQAIPAFKELYKKIKRHKEHILNTIRYGMSNARIEATNNKIKLIIRKAYGFRNIQNMLDMVYLVCSDIKIPLPNRKTKVA